MSISTNGYILTVPSYEYRNEWCRAIEELKLRDGKIVPSNLNANSFEEFIEHTTQLSIGQNLPEGYVRSELLFLVSEKNPNLIIGATDLRLGTNEMIERFYGHAGGCILPNYRKKGLGMLIIALTLQRFKTHGFSKVTLTCEPWNKASRSAIIANGGVYVGTDILNGKEFERYHVNL